MPETAYRQRTLLADILLAVLRDARDDDSVGWASVTAYHFTNSGQGVDLDIYQLPLQITKFLFGVQKAPNQQAWERIVSRGWQTPKANEKDKSFKPRYNSLYEDLFSLPEGAPQFVRTYLLRIPRRYGADKQDPTLSYSPRDEASFVNWGITELFLKGVMNMDQERITEIRALGDRLAKYVQEHNDKGFFRNFYTASKPFDLRNVLLRANLASARSGGPLLLEFEPYIKVFEEGEDLARLDWKLARDLVLIRMIEQLYQAGWIGKNSEDLPDKEQAVTNEQSN